MNSNGYLLKALDAFQRKIAVISPQFKILATMGYRDGRSAKQLLGSQCFQAFFGRTQACENCPAVTVQNTHQPAMCHNHLGAMDPQSVNCIYSYPILDGDTVEAMVMVDFDITNLQIIEEDLRRSNAFLRNLLFSAMDCVIATDLTVEKGKIRIFNEAASRLFGYSIDEAIKSLNIIDMYTDDGARQVMRKLRSERYGGKGRLQSQQVSLISKSGEIIPVNLRATIIYDDGREIATIGFFHDLRESIRMKKELEKTQLQLMQAEKMASLGKLAAGVAHQLNNPLGGITLFTRLMLEEYDLPAAATQDLGRILKDAQRCRDTVKELLEFARQTRHEMRPNDINATIERTLFLLENQTLFHNIDIVKRLGPAIPPVPSDSQQLNHLLMNIILNAAQAMDGKGRLSVKTFLQAEMVCIEISDSGPGISADILPHIFEPFFTTKEEGQGTGLGLSMVYGIVENHGGKISARSTPDEGTCFMIELPVTADNV